MRYEPFLCLAGVEIANHARVSTYVNNVGLGSAAWVTFPTACACSILDEGYDRPDTDPAPWYEPTRPESADFLGLYATDIVPQTVAGRSSTARSGWGTQLGPLQAKGRILQVSGLMQAHSPAGMEYGERWLKAALRGSPCGEGGCPGDDLLILPSCPENPDYVADEYFRTLVNVGLMDGPVFGPVGGLPEHFVQRASFILASSQPWFYHAPERIIDGEDLGVAVSGALTTPEWMGDGTFRIEVINSSTTPSTDIVINGQVSLDGSCPVTGDGRSVPYSFEYAIPTLAPEERIVIDGARRQVEHYDASEKFARSGFAYLDFEGPFKWPDVGPCTTMCLSISGGTSNTQATVDAYLREL